MPDSDIGDGLIEPLSRPLFWVLAIFLIAFWWMTAQAAPEPASTSNLPKSWSIQYLQWLEPYLNSYIRKVTALGVYLGILGLQLLEGWWILQIDWRVYGGLWVQLPNDGMDFFSFIRWSLAVGTWSVLVALNLGAGVLILMVQLSCTVIADIISVKPRQTDRARCWTAEKEKGGRSYEETG